jgi:hypothetical protein
MWNKLKELDAAITLKEGNGFRVIGKRIFGEKSEEVIGR